MGNDKTIHDRLYLASMIPVVGSTLAGVIEIPISVFDILKHSSHAIVLGNNAYYPTPWDQIVLSAERIGYHAANMVTLGVFGWCFMVKVIGDSIGESVGYLTD